MKSIIQIINSNFSWEKRFKKTTLYEDLLDYLIYMFEKNDNE